MSQNDVPILWKIARNLDALPDEAFSRMHPDNVWVDLWTNRDTYEKYIKTFIPDGSASYDFKDFEKINSRPKVIPMFGWFDLLPLTEMPANYLRWVVISSRILECIKNFSEVRYKTYPIRVLDRSQYEDVYSQNVRNYEGEIPSTLNYRDDWFLAIELSDEISLLDPESDLLESPTKRIWREDAAQIPLPAFFTEKMHGGIFVSAEGKKALEDAEIKGIEFIDPTNPLF